MNVTLPNESLEQAEDIEHYDITAVKHFRVLVFGLDKDIRLMFKTALELWNYETAEAETVEEAADLAENVCPDLVLMDTELVFAQSLSEMQVMQNFRSFQKVPFILLSGHAQANVRRTAIAAGATDFLVKPVNLDVLEVVIESCLTNTNHTTNANHNTNTNHTNNS